jgi:hypothetical protein
MTSCPLAVDHVKAVNTRPVAPQMPNESVVEAGVIEDLRVRPAAFT